MSRKYYKRNLHYKSDSEIAGDILCGIIGSLVVIGAIISIILVVQEIGY